MADESKQPASSDTALAGKPDTDVLAATVAAIYPDGAPAGAAMTIKDCSGRSGARGFLVMRDETPVAMVKVEGESVLHSHPASGNRIRAATAALRAHGCAPALLARGKDWYAEEAAGVSVMKDFFHFDEDKAPRKAIAALLARVHSAPIDWYAPLQEEYAQRDPALSPILAKAAPHSWAWHLPWTGIDTGKVVMGMGQIPDSTTTKVHQLLVETGVWEKVILCEAFYPVTEAGRRLIVNHGDFKPDNVLRSSTKDELVAIDFDLTQVAPAVHEFGFMLMMWYGPSKTTFEYRRDFVRDYLELSALPASDADVAAFMLDCEVATICAFPGLLAHIYDKEVPLLRGTPHPTAKATAGSADDSPTGPEIVDLLAEAVTKVRSDPAIADRVVKEGLVPTVFALEGLGSDTLFAWLKAMQNNNMLRLFGIAP